MARAFDWKGKKDRYNAAKNEKVGARAKGIG